MAKCVFAGCDFGGLYSAPELKGKRYCLIHREEMIRRVRTGRDNMTTIKSREEHRDAINQARTEFKKLIAEARGRYGRDFVRGLPQGKLLDALDANRKSGFPTDV